MTIVFTLLFFLSNFFFTVCSFLDTPHPHTLNLCHLQGLSEIRKNSKNTNAKNRTAYFLPTKAWGQAWRQVLCLYLGAGGCITVWVKLTFTDFRSQHTSFGFSLRPQYEVLLRAGLHRAVALSLCSPWTWSPTDGTGRRVSNLLGAAASPR